MSKLAGAFALGHKDITKPWVATLGNFDGFHLGHQKLLNALKILAKEHDALSVAFTFQPHPRSFLEPGGKESALLYDEAKKEALFSQFGIDILYKINFTQEIAQLSPAVFFTEYFLPFAPLRAILVGSDFRFGASRSGKPEQIKEQIDLWQKNHHQKIDFSCFAIDPAEKKLYSSTHVRALLKANRFLDAAHILNRWWSVQETVVTGSRRGSKLGFATANLKFTRLLPIGLGVYCVVAKLPGDTLCPGLMNYGVRPSFPQEDKTSPIAEIHLLGYTGDLYDKQLEIFPLHKIREEKTFTTIYDLQVAIEQDRQFAYNNWLNIYQSFHAK